MRKPLLVMLGLVVTTAVLVVPASPSASAEGRGAAAAGAAGAAPRITLRAQSPWVPAHGVFLVGVTIANAPARTDVRVSVHRPLPDRAALNQTIGSDDAGDELFNLDVLPIEDQPAGPGGTRQVSVAIPIKESGPAANSQPGIYPVQIRLQRRRPDGTILARLTTYLVRTPEKGALPARLRAALVVKVHVPLTTRDGGRPTVKAAQLRPPQALVDALRDHPDLPATMVPTPQTMEALRDSRGGGGRALLDDLQILSRSERQVLAGSYVRLDASAWARAGLIDELARQRLIGATILASILDNVDSRTSVADEDVTAEAVGRLRDSGVQQLVIPERSFAPLDRALYPDSPTEPFKVITDTGIPMPAVQIDSRLQDAFERATDPVLGANQMLAELSLASLEQNDSPGGIVFGPPDRWKPSPIMLKVLLDGLGPTNPLVTATTVDRIFAEVPPAGSNGSAPLRKGADRGVDLVRTLASPGVPALGSLPEQLRHARTRLASYRSMVGQTSPRLSPLERLVDLAGSADLPTGRQDHLFALVDRTLDRQFARITTPEREQVTLTARDADFPLTLQSRLGYPVNVVIDLRSSNRLTFPDGNRIAVRLVGQRTRVKLRVRAPVSGDTPLQVTVRSADGNIELARSNYTVRSTAVSGVGVVLTTGAALFLVIWWIRHWRSSARTRRNGQPTS